MFLERPRHRLRVADIAFDKSVRRIIAKRGQIGQVAGISQRIETDGFTMSTRHPIEHKVGSNKACGTCYDNRIHSPLSIAEPLLNSTPIIGWFGPLLALTGTWISLRLMLNTRLVHATKDDANERSLHHGSVPRIGGLAIAIGLILALLLSWPPSALLWVIASCYATLLAVSLLDDLYRLAVIPRLLVQIAAAFGALVWFQFDAPALLVCALALVWSANLYNFMDGSDGLAGGMTVVGFASYSMLAAIAGQAELAMACASIAAAALAFLWFNFHPARLFLGDAGSIPLGFSAGLIGCLGWQLGCWPLWLPVIIFFPFVFDASFTLLRRGLSGQPIWHAHREHIYQRAILAGLSHRQLACRAYALMVGCALLAIFNVNATFSVGGLIITAQTLLGLTLAWRYQRSTNPIA